MIDNPYDSLPQEAAERDHDVTRELRDMFDSFKGRIQHVARHYKSDTAKSAVLSAMDGLDDLWHDTFAPVEKLADNAILTRSGRGLGVQSDLTRA